MKDDLIRLGFLVFLAVSLAACSGETGAGATQMPPGTGAPAEITPTPTSFQPPSPETEPSATPTPIPMALFVNGQGISLDDFNLAMQRFHLGLPEIESDEARARVLDDMIDQMLLAQAAAEAGFTLSDEEFRARLAALTEEAGGEAALEAWLEANLYTRELFERDLRLSISAAWMRDRVFAEVPLSAEQVRARQIRVTSRAEADSILAQLNGGTSFDLLALVYDPEGLGELGWFPRGVLFQPAIEEIAFSLSVGDYAGVIETPAGFHIIQVTDRAADRPLDPDALWALQLQALEAWLESRRSAGAIEILVP